MKKLIVAGALAGLLCACPKKSTEENVVGPKTTPPAASSGPASGPSGAAAPSPSPANAPANAPGAAPGLAGEGKMVHCPSSVEGATTEVKDTADGVDVTVTAKDAAKVADIRTRAKHLASVSVKDPVDVKHTGEGEGGGGRGHCPVVLQNTKIEVAEVEGGAKISVKPVKPEELEWLKKEAHSREGRVADALRPAGSEAPVPTPTPNQIPAPAPAPAPAH